VAERHLCAPAFAAEEPVIPHPVEQLIRDMPLRPSATLSLTECIDSELLPLYVKGLDAYTKFLRTMQTLGEEITIAIGPAHPLSEKPSLAPPLAP
jgi:hypothetical protein